MKKWEKYIPHSLVTFYLIVYLISTINHLDVFSDILSPVGALIAFSIIFLVLRKTKNYNIIILSLALSCLFWAISDIIWAVCEIGYRLDPNEMYIFTALYLLPNIFIALAVGMFFYKMAQKLNKVQLFLDIITISVACSIIFWDLVLQKSIMILFKNLTIFTLSVYMFTDFFAIITLIIWLFSIRSGKLKSSMYLTVFGICLYATIDLIYSYQSIYHLYIPNSSIDTFYILSLLLMVHGVYLLQKQYHGFFQKNYSISTNNVGSSKRAFILLTFPVIQFIFKGYEGWITLLLISIFFIYLLLSSYVQNALKNEQLLALEKNLNSVLEEQIATRTKELIDTNKELKMLSKQDFITSIYNRRYFITKLDQMLQERNDSIPITIFYIDLDRFKSINDTFGHDIGDSVLIEVSKRLTIWNTYDALFARLGGDEFVFAFKGSYNMNEIEDYARSIIACISKPIYIEQYQFNITVSIGITSFPKDGNERSWLMKNADIAMYHAKENGKNQYAIFNSYMNDNALRKHEIEILLKKANYDNEFELFYQPQFDTNSKSVVGIEALIRWNSPEKGRIMPGEFIPIAEEIGCIERIGEWIMEEAIRQITAWNIRNNCNLRVAINISPNQLDGINFVNRLKKVIDTFHARTEWIEIEITESIAMKGETAMEEIFSKLEDIGISTAIDDFGTGYSSLSYIKQFSFDRVKIAKPLIDSISTDVSNLQIVKAIIMMTKAIGIKTIAEGVETDEQYELLKLLECDEIQGYVFCKPIPAHEFENKYLHQNYK